MPYVNHNFGCDFANEFVVFTGGLDGSLLVLGGRFIQAFHPLREELLLD